jgi:energy-coupling factor transporter ATP-binding protein EcfA2
MSSYDDYEALIDSILNADDRFAFEAAVGNALGRGPRTTLIVEGKAGSGKSTLLKIAERVLADSNDIYFQHDGQFAAPRNARYMFTASNTYVSEGDENVVRIRTTGNRLSNEQYIQCIDTIREYPGLIALRCVDRYITSTRNFQEN